jgi:hypothetical protein
MENCYPAILLFVSSILVYFQISRALWWKAGLVLGSIPFCAGLVSLLLCKKGYKKLSWMLPLLAIIIFFSIVAMM